MKKAEAWRLLEPGHNWQRKFPVHLSKFLDLKRLAIILNTLKKFFKNKNRSKIFCSPLWSVWVNHQQPEQKEIHMQEQFIKSFPVKDKRTLLMVFFLYLP